MPCRRRHAARRAARRARGVGPRGRAVPGRAGRRARRRVLAARGLYAGAAVGLSAVPGLVGGQWAVMATFVEESGEALGAVAVLVSVLVGVAPRLVLPAARLQRGDEAPALEAAVGRRAARRR